MKTIGIFHYQVGGTDGVSLEIDKWKQVLEEMGHVVHLCAGDLGTVHGTRIEELYHHREDAERLNTNTFTALRDYDENAYRKELYSLAESIERKVRHFVHDNGIDFMIPQNVWSVAASPSVAIALAQVTEDMQLPALAHNHDFYWERVDGVALTCATAVEVADKYLPPRHPLVKHAVINSLAQRELASRKGIESTVIPNVFDFEGNHWRQDSYNWDFRDNLGLKENDILLLQATRIVPRKGIELAIDFARALDSPERRARLEQQGLFDGRPFTSESRIVLVLAGYAQDDATGQYLSKLKRKVQETGVDALFIEDRVGGRRQLRDGSKVYSLWDTYVFADFVTYPSLWEGWGNQLLEAVVARVPLMLFEYPVYLADIKTAGLQAVSLGSELRGRDQQGLVMVAPEMIEAAADQAVELLVDKQLRRATVERNFRVGRQYYSLDALRGYLSGLLGE